MTQTQSHRVVLSLGANLGDLGQTLQSAIDSLASDPRIRVTAVSSAYQTAPVGGPAQPDYLNAVVLASTSRSAEQLLEFTQSVEAAHLRQRTIRWGPRTLDIDIIDFDGQVSQDPRLTLPHPRAWERAFVLVPWLEVDPAAQLATHQEPITQLIEAVPASQSVKVARGVTLRIPQAPTLEG